VTEQESGNARALASDRCVAHLRIEPQGLLIALEDVPSGRILLPPALFSQPQADDFPCRIAFAAKAGGNANSLGIRWTGAGGNSLAEADVVVEDQSLRWQLRPARDSQPIVESFPFLAPLFAGGEPKAPVGDPGDRRFRDGWGRPIVRHADWPLPVVRTDPGGRTLTLLAGIGEDVPVDAVGAELIVHDGGWPEAFDRFRQRIRARFDLELYDRPEEAWYQRQLVQHFTFLYGREILNMEEGAFDLDRFLDEAERDFGGYDGMLAWGVYPRIGIDERTQWDFFDDLPGGRAGLRDLARRARERGVRFFVPYKPWDIAAEARGEAIEPPHEGLATLVADVEADGVFLDTMSAIDRTFRDALDRVRPGVVLCSEGRVKGAAFETITGSWDQSRSPEQMQGNWSAPAEVMPGIDLWRFVFPEHPLFVVNRTAVGDDRMRIIQRGFFGGMGWVIWQDIFGLVLSYSPEEAALLKRCRTILREHLGALRGPRPTPLVDTLAPGVYANEFPGQAKRLWTLYNETPQPIAGPVLRVQPAPNAHYVDVWTNQEVSVDDEGRLCVALSPRAVGAVVEMPKALAFDAASGTLSVLEAPEGAVVEIIGAGPAQTLSVNGDSFDLRGIALTQAVPGLARLLASGELVDQIVLQWEG
jgi:hypothetical protein